MTSCHRVHRNSVAGCTCTISRPPSPALHPLSAATTTSLLLQTSSHSKTLAERFFSPLDRRSLPFQTVAPTRVAPSRSGLPYPSRSTSSVARHPPTPIPSAQPHPPISWNRRASLRRSRLSTPPREPVLDHSTRPSHGSSDEAASRHQERSSLTTVNLSHRVESACSGSFFLNLIIISRRDVFPL